MATAVDPGIFRYVLGFLMVGIAWGFTTPFIRKAALYQRFEPPATLQDPETPRWKRTLISLLYVPVNLARNPAYTIPLLVNLSGSALFFLIVGKAELSLTVPITNSLAFLFTVLGEWVAEGKSISRDTWIGMALVLSGIGICVHSKNQQL